MSLRGTPPIAESLRRLLAQRRAATDADPGKAEPARQARRRAGLRSVESTHQALRDATEAKARAAGFRSMRAAIEGTSVGSRWGDTGSELRL